MLDSQNPCRIIAATTCIGPYKKYLDGWVDNFNDIEYSPHKLQGLISQPKAKNLKSGEEINNFGRQRSVEIAITNNVDWLMFVDADIRVDKDVVYRFLDHNYPFVAGALSARDDPNRCIGHIWKNKAENDATWLTKEMLIKPITVDSVGGGLMIVHRDIFTKIDLAKYKGPQNYSLPYMGADMFFADQVFETTGYKPIMDPDINAWHLFEKQKTRLWGKREFSDREIT